MNEVFRHFLRRFVLVFFDDIPVCSRSWSDHLNHLRAVLKVLERYKLYAKLSKCQLRASKVEYLGYIICPEGVKADPFKVAAMINWPIPINVKSLRGFLELTGYYHKFI